MSYEQEMNLAVKAAKLAGMYLKKRENIQVDALQGKDIKLSSDKESEKMILGCLAESGIGILSEECGLRGGDGSILRWIVDPIDGTQNYYRGLDELACVSIALWNGSKPVFGVVYRFAADELFIGEAGAGASLNGKTLVSPKTGRIQDAVLATGFPVKRDYSAESLSVFVRQVQRFKKVRMLGSAALMAAFVAAGYVDAYIEEEIMLWDVAAAMAIVQAAGGVVDFRPLADNKCICRCFANRALMEDYYAQGF